VLSDFAGKLWGFLIGILRWFGDAFSRLMDWLGSLFGDLKNFLAKLMQSLVNALGEMLYRLFKPIFDIITAIIHFIAKLFEILWLLLQIFLQLGHIIIAFITGLFRTLAGLTYDGSTPALDANMSGAAAGMNQAMSILQLDTLAYLCLFGIWIVTAVSVIRMIGNFSGGGGD
jgi:hypothetical protein